MTEEELYIAWLLERAPGDRILDRYALEWIRLEDIPELMGCYADLTFGTIQHASQIAIPCMLAGEEHPNEVRTESGEASDSSIRELFRKTWTAFKGSGGRQLPEKRGTPDQR